MVAPNPLGCLGAAGPKPARPEGIEFFDNDRGGISLDRPDSVDFLLYVAELEAWSAVVNKACN